LTPKKKLAITSETLARELPFEHANWVPVFDASEEKKRQKIKRHLKG
jgi:hypothetical protein